MLADTSEVIDRGMLFSELTREISIIATDCISAEFKYIRTGFILAHYGRRGVTHSIWHWADWEETWEYFCQAWYCYGRTIDDMSPLDRNEPVLCHYEIDIVMQEALALRDIALHCSDHDEIVRLYRAHDPLKDSKR